MAAPAFHLRATVLPHGDAPRDLYLVDGRITFGQVEGAVELAPPGGYLSCGLVDSHTHLYFVQQPLTHCRAFIDDNRRQHLARGVTLLRDMGAISDEVIGLPEDDGLPRVQAAGRCLVIEPRPPFVITEPSGLSARAASQARVGAQWVKIFADWPGWPGGQEEPPFGDDPLSYSEETLAEAVGVAHAHEARVATHAFGREGAEAAVAAGVDSIEHGWGLDEALLAEMARKRIAWTPMLGIAEPMLRGAEKDNNGVQAAWIRATLMRMVKLLPEAQRLGVPILAGSDWFPAVSLLDDVLALHRHGLTVAQALASATTSARAFLGAPGLDEGAPADLVLYRDDPRDDLTVLGRPELVVMGGRVAPRSASAPLTGAGARA